MNHGHRFGVLLILLMATVPAVAAQDGGFSGVLKSTSIGENVSVNVTVRNTLPVTDTLVITFAGPAITSNRIVQPHFPPGTCPEAFDTGEERCEVTIPPDESETVTIWLEGTAQGQEELSATVNSSTSGLSASDKMAVRVQPKYAPVTVSAPGITAVQMVASAVIGALAVFFLH